MQAANHPALVQPLHSAVRRPMLETASAGGLRRHSLQIRAAGEGQAHLQERKRGEEDNRVKASVVHPVVHLLKGRTNHDR